MDFDLGEQAADLRTRLRELIDEHTPEGFLGAFTDDPADLDVTQAFCRMLADADLLTIAWPTEYGGGGGSLWDQTVVRELFFAQTAADGTPKQRADFRRQQFNRARDWAEAQELIASHEIDDVVYLRLCSHKAEDDNEWG